MQLPLFWYLVTSLNQVTNTDPKDVKIYMVVPTLGSLVACKTWGCRKYYHMTVALHAVQFKPYLLLAWAPAASWDRPGMNMFICLKVSHTQKPQQNLVRETHCQAEHSGP